MASSRVTVTREQLYAQVWAEPMVAIAQRYRVSSSYLARVCEHINVPRPPRGYWAKERVGRAPERPPLPASRPGEVLAWAKGEGVPRPPRETGRPRADDTPPMSGGLSGGRTERHSLVAGVRQFFAAARVSDEGYLRPLKRNLIDLLASQETLTYALDTANRILQTLEARGHRVTLSSDAHFHRPELALYDSQTFDERDRELWRPGRLTVVFIRDTAFGLSFCESSEEAEVTYNWDHPVRYQKIVEQSRSKRSRTRYTHENTAYKRQMPCGRIALRAYSPYRGVTWEQYWRERNVGDLAKKSIEILTALETAIPSIASLRAEAQERAERRRREWEIERKERELRDREQRRADAHKQSQHQLREIVANWAVARNIERFFQYAARRVRQLPPNAQANVVDRLDHARQLLGAVDPLSHFEEWLTPEELLPPDDNT
jgi:hypothetical protein